jgi:hypothetical protein
MVIVHGYWIMGNEQCLIVRKMCEGINGNGLQGERIQTPW